MLIILAKILSNVLSVLDLIKLLLTKEKSHYMSDEHLLITEEIDLNERI